MRTIRRITLVLAMVMPLLGWLLAGCSEKGSVNGAEDDQQQADFLQRPPGASGSDAELAVGSAGIWTLNADGSDRTQVLDSSASNPAWSPDGKKIAFTRIVEESAAALATPESVPSIVVMDADGSDQRELLDEPASDPDCAPDGKKIAFSKSAPGGRGSLRPNVSYPMVPQTHLVDGVRYNTGEVTIQSAHSFGGSAYQSSTANSGHIERIPRWF